MVAESMVMFTLPLKLHSLFSKSSPVARASSASIPMFPWVICSPRNIIVSVSRLKEDESASREIGRGLSGASCAFAG